MNDFLLFLASKNGGGSVDEYWLAGPVDDCVSDSVLLRAIVGLESVELELRGEFSSDNLVIEDETVCKGSWVGVSSHNCFDLSKNDSVAESNSEHTYLSKLYTCVGIALVDRLMDDLDPFGIFPSITVGSSLSWSGDPKLRLFVSEYAMEDAMLCLVGCLDRDSTMLLVLESEFESADKENPLFEAEDFERGFLSP